MNRNSPNSKIISSSQISDTFSVSFLISLPTVPLFLAVLVHHHKVIEGGNLPYPNHTTVPSSLIQLRSFYSNSFHQLPYSYRTSVPRCPHTPPHSAWGWRAWSRRVEHSAMERERCRPMSARNDWFINTLLIPASLSRLNLLSMRETRLFHDAPKIVFAKVSIIIFGHKKSYRLKKNTSKSMIKDWCNTRLVRYRHLLDYSI